MEVYPDLNLFVQDSVRARRRLLMSPEVLSGPIHFGQQSDEGPVTAVWVWEEALGLG